MGEHELMLRTLLPRFLLLGLALWLAAGWTTERVYLHPRHWTVGETPASRGWAYRDVSFVNSGGMTLRGWWIPGTRHRTVVMVHGWSASRREPMSRAGYLHDSGYNLLVFDLRGHGASDGVASTLGQTEPDDVASAVRLAHRLDPGPVALFGYSLGASSAIEAAGQGADVRAVIEDSGFATLDGIIRAQVSQVTGLPAAIPLTEPVLWFGRLIDGIDAARVRPVDYAARLSQPVLAIVGTADRMVPPSQGRELFAALGGPKQLLVVKGAGHVEGYRKANALYERTVLAFLEQTMSG